ncbi:MAG TPA: hypothetical protein VFK05_08925 [Polyangiaceae bacterium]|nr:hypothetical protein [Polyangiaceae bacterium]
MQTYTRLLAQSYGKAPTVLLTGIHLMQTSEVVANIQVLDERFRLTAIDDQVTRTHTGAEKS